MIVRKIEKSNDVLEQIEFVRQEEDDAAFKSAITVWIKRVYPNMNFQQLWSRLEEFAHGICRVSMK